MGIYARFVLPALIDLAMRNPEATRLRAARIPAARGEVLELGIGSGLNLPFYSAEVRRVIGVDPSRELQKRAEKRARALRFAVDFLSCSAEGPLPLEDASVDTAVTTWTLCSIPDPLRALREVHRILKPEGRLIFVEHGRAPDWQVSRWQERLTPVWSRLAGGCRLDRKIDELLAEAGFEIAELCTSYLRGPRPFTYTYQGFARRTA